MRIQHFSCFEVIVPTHEGVIESKGINKPLHKLPRGARSGWSMQFDQLPKLILKMELSNGIIGWGELYRDHNWKVVEEIIEVLLGRDIRDLPLQKLPFTFCREYDGFECAIWDAYAKAHHLRVVDLLGGPVREKIKVGAWSSHRHLEEIGDLADRFARQGYDCLKFKTDLEDDVVGWCRAIQETAPQMKVILDPNERWLYPGEVRKRAEGLAEVGNVLCLEDPLPRWMLEEYALLRQTSSVPIALHVSLPYILHGQRIKDAVQALQKRAVDGFNFNCGLANFQRLDHIATAAGLPCWHGSEVDLGILEAMYVHSAAAAESCIWPSDIFGRLIRTHDLLKTPLKIEPPYAYLPEGLGLGVEPDEDAIANFQISKKEFTAGFTAAIPHSREVKTEGSSAKRIPAGASQHSTAGPYSPVLEVIPGQLIVLSGQAAIDKDGQVIGDTIEEQTHATLKNCRVQLQTAGCDFKDVFKVNVYLTDLDNWPRFNDVYSTYFPEPRPVRTAVQTPLLMTLLVEIEIWAVKK